MHHGMLCDKLVTEDLAPLESVNTSAVIGSYGVRI